jgi:3-O-methylgallate 3,4-dioxygenase
MARIVLGLGTSHGPMLSTPPEQWDARVAADRQNRHHRFKGKTYNFEELVMLRAAEPLAAEITLDKWRQRAAACRAAILRLAGVFDEMKPDVAVLIGNDQMEVFDEKLVPAFTVFCGETIDNIPYTAEQMAKLEPGTGIAVAGHQPPQKASYPGRPDLADHIVESLIADSFDVAVSRQLPEGPRGSGAPHAFGFVYRQIMADKVVPHVPIFINTFYPPNQPRAKRCFDLGRSLARAIEAWPADATVALIASGGLSHFVIDEELDRTVIEALRTGAIDRLAAIPESLFQSGASEIKNWIPVAGAMAELGMTMNLIDYVPCYRSLAGTGNAMAFAFWQ